MSVFLLFIGFLVCAGLLFCIFAVRGFIDSLQTMRNTRRQGNRSDRRTKVRRGAVDAVSKNAFTQPFLRLCEIRLFIGFLVCAGLLFCGFAVRGFIDSLHSPTVKKVGELLRLAKRRVAKAMFDKNGCGSGTPPLF